LQAGARYVPTGYDGALAVMRAESSAAGPGGADGSRHEDRADPWLGATSGEVMVHRVPSDHYSILRAPAVSAVAEQIGRSARRAGYGTSSEDES
ncbi:MAG: hypothetical protein AAGC55_33765, partial [Myxococcota bacterium]